MTSLPSTYVSQDAVPPGVRTLQSFAELLLSAWERWIAINLDAVRAGSNSASVTLRALLDEALRSQMAAYEESVERTSEYMRSVNHLCLDTQAAMAQFNVDTMMESTSSMPAFLARVGTAAGPQAAHGVLAVMQSAMNNGSMIYERMLQTGRELADSNLAVATHALQPMLPQPKRPERRSRKVA